jgi:hypothetical protein
MLAFFRTTSVELIPLGPLAPLELFLGERAADTFSDLVLN